MFSSFFFGVWDFFFDFDLADLAEADAETDFFYLFSAGEWDGEICLIS